MKNIMFYRFIKTVPATLGLTCALCVLLLGSTTLADTIRLDKRSVAGDIKKMTADNVTITRGSSSEADIAANKITAIVFTNEPKKLSQAREAAVSGRFEDALSALKELDSGKLSGYTAADAAFYEAMAAAELALRGRAPIKEAGRKLIQFAKTYPNNYHYYPATQLIGDLLIEAGQPDVAAAYYQKLAQAPWPKSQIDAKIATALALLADGKTPDAQALINQVVTSGTLTPAQKVKVELLKAQSLINQNKPDDAIRLVEAVIKAIPPEAIDINAQTYNLLGRAHRRANRPQDALLAFLHVDLLYPGNALAHAEALGNLAELWATTHVPDRARIATETLKQRYPYSRWNK